MNNNNQAYISEFLELKVNKTKKALEKNNFEVFIAENAEDAKNIIMKEIVEKSSYKIVSWGDSLSMMGTGIIDELSKRENYNIIKSFEENLSREVVIERRRQALLSDLFFTGTNALTETGKLVNLDKIGNRVAGITFGPKKVVIVVGYNKIVKDESEAKERIKNYAAPLNALRHDYITPCTKTGDCHDCLNDNRICNVWTIHEKSFPKHRISVIIVKENLGL